MINQWFKMYGGEYLSDPKMKSLTDSERSCWITLLCYASISSVEGEVMHLTEKQLMLDSSINPLGENWNKTIGVLSKFEKLGMTKIGGVGQIVIIHWNERQERLNMSGYDRIKRHRERTKNKEQIEAFQTEPFSEFWTAYPRKIGKKTAFMKWCALNPDLMLKEKILATVARYSRSPQWIKDDGQFIPYPSTWLSQERWEDEIKESLEKQKKPFFDNYSMFKKGNQWFVIVNGEFKEFAGKEKDIIWK